MGYGKFKIIVHWCNGSDDYEVIFNELKKMCEKYQMSHMIIGAEIAPTTGKNHVDGYYEYTAARKNDTELKKFNRHLGKGWGRLIGPCNGSAGENFDYSTKEGRMTWQHGEPAKQGVRKDLVSAQAAINQGVSVNTLTEENPELFHTYGRTLNKLEDLRLRKIFRTEMTEGVWLWGGTGTGKSHRAFEGYTPETHYNLIDRS